MSCQKNYDISDQSSAVSPQIGTVPLNVATNIATNFFKMYYENVDNKLIDNQLTADENGVPIFYLFNYKNGGFLILSAEYGDMPILANDVTTIFPAKGEDINPGLGKWLVDTRDRIVAIRSGKEPCSKVGAAMWKDFKNNTFKATFKNITIDDIRRNADKAQLRDDDLGIPYDPNSAQNYCYSYPWINTTLAPLMTTRWGQGCGYNDLTPAYPLDPLNGLCGHAPTGCVATAMAQVIKCTPSTGFNVNFSSMPNNTGSSETAKLMDLCGRGVYMDYGQSASGAYTSNIEHLLEFRGYSTDVSYGDYDSNIHLANLNLGRPVILDGCTGLTCFLWWCWGTGDCHAWVSDGYQRSYHTCYGATIQWHMNWGWSGDANGFYYYPMPILSNPPANWSRYYHYARGILYNVHL